MRMSSVFIAAAFLVLATQALGLDGTPLQKIRVVGDRLYLYERRKEVFFQKCSSIFEDTIVAPPTIAVGDLLRFRERDIRVEALLLVNHPRLPSEHMVQGVNSPKGFHVTDCYAATSADFLPSDERCEGFYVHVEGCAEALAEPPPKPLPPARQETRPPAKVPPPVPGTSPPTGSGR